MEKIFIHIGSDQDFMEAIKHIEHYFTISEIIKQISKETIVLQGFSRKEDPPLDVDNLVISTDDYGAIKEWAILGASNNILENPQIKIRNLYLNNPPKKFYENIKKSYSDIIEQKESKRQDFNLEILKKISKNYNKEIIGQPNVLKKLLPSLYALVNPSRKKPVTLLFLGGSGIGKTETAKFINSQLSGNMLRIQFSMQQTNEAYKYIFGGEHGEDSFARDLIRRESDVILLDEFDKVNRQFYNAFYQMFDEGIFVDNNYNVNVERCIIICTSNFMSEKEAEYALGTPILSRFSKIIKFEDIRIDDKLLIAKRHYCELFDNLEEEDKKLIQSNHILEHYQAAIKKGYYQNMRMLKNDIEDAIYIEILKAREIM